MKKYDHKKIEKKWPAFAKASAGKQKYKHSKIERKWQKIWQNKGVYKTSEAKNKPKYYVLDMFPYPSGAGLHVGHPKGYIATDVIARQKMMQGFNVLHPMGWDAFGLPTENYALKSKVHPAIATAKNIATFKKQLKLLGLTYDWGREVNTTDPKYYRWTQWAFLQMFKRGLAYESYEPVNWCPADKTVLANEDLENGKCERCGAVVEKKPLRQWALKITNYAECLLSDLSKLTGWPEPIKLMQKEWIGKSEGALVNFLIPQYNEIIFATSNVSKKARIENLLKSAGLNIQITCAEANVEEDGDLLTNAKNKALAFKGESVPVLAVDTGFFIDGEKIDPVKVKRNALQGKNERDFTQKEIGEKMLAYYQNIARQRGGKVDAYWLDAWVLLLPSGEIKTAEARRDVILTSKQQGELDIYLPVRCLYKAVATGKYAVLHTKEEELLELQPVTNALFSLLCENLPIFTTRPDTLFGATYLVVSPEHQVINNKQLTINNSDEVSEYVATAKNKSDLERTENKEKTGVELKGAKAINPATKKEIPIWVADYVLSGYGTGAIMAVPAHDERDFEFAKKFGLPIKEVVAQQVGNRLKNSNSRRSVRGVVIKDGKLMLVFDKKMNEYILVGGGIEPTEQAETSMLREIEEESGFKNAKIISSLGVLEHNYYHPLKKCNWQSQVFGFVLQLIDNQTKERERLEIEKTDIVWLPVEEAMQKLKNSPTFGPELVFIERYLNQKLLCFSGEGIAINSDLLNGLSTVEAKAKIISWLEQNSIGKRQVQYKLRDWVFSRQRYWGEPIPLIHCNNCQNKKYNYVLIHGFKGTATSTFKPWLKKELEKQGHKVFSPSLPNTNEPNINEQVKYILDNTKIDKNTVLVGTSLGGAVIFKLLEKIKTKVTKVVMVDCFVRPEFPDKRRPEVENSCDWKFNFEKVKKKANEFVVLGDANFVTVGKEQLDEMAKIFDAKYLLVEPSSAHFNNDVEPAVLRVCINDGWRPVPEKDLPLELPKVKNYEPSGTGESPLANIKEWVNTKCPVCGGPARRETNTMPQWAGSCWYYLRYIDAHNNKALVDNKKEKYWSPVDLYVGGAEHATRHLIYARFWHKFLYDIGAVNYVEPFTKLQSVGLILAEDGRKMSKRWGNVINPDDVVKEFGADSLRVYEMFMCPFTQATAWSTNGLIGAKRFLDRVWGLQDKVSDIPPNPPFAKGGKHEPSLPQKGGQGGILPSRLTTLLHQTIKKVSEDIENMRFNTAISQLMILVNEMSKEPRLLLTPYSLLLKLFSPFAPHITQELWSILGNKNLIINESWPKFDPALAKDQIITIAIQVNGKVRDEISVDADTSEEEIKKLALQSEKAQKWLEGKQPKKVIYVKGRLVSIVA